jgi:hypothetical protein
MPSPDWGFVRDTTLFFVVLYTWWGWHTTKPMGWVPLWPRLKHILGYAFVGAITAAVWVGVTQAISTVWPAP